MKKKIRTELEKLAEKILQKDYDVAELKAHSLKIYEKLTLLEFVEKQIGTTSEAPVQEIPRPEEKPVSRAIPQTDEFAPDGTEYREGDAITEPATEKIKDIVSEMPVEEESNDSLFGEMPQPEPPREAPKPKPAPKKEKPVAREKPTVNNNSTPKKDFRDIGVDYDNLPNFEPLNNRQKENRPQSLNDRLKKGINIGLNERLTFIKHLFDGNTADYNRVLSQLNTINSLEEAQKFIEKIVKPDYNNWEGKEEYETRFREKIENRFEQ